MIRALTIFNNLNLFHVHDGNPVRHGSAELVFRSDPVLVNTAVRELVTAQEKYRVCSNHKPTVQPRWNVITEKGKRPELRMSWSAIQQGGRQP